MKNIRINTEDFIFIILIFCSVFNIIGNSYMRKNKKNLANQYYLMSIIVTTIIYFYFFYRNYDLYKRCSKSEKKNYIIKLIGLSFLISGAFCLIYFQINTSNEELPPVL